eukprot:127525-Amphidinium_carterae.1
MCKTVYTNGGGGRGFNRRCFSEFCSSAHEGILQLSFQWSLVRAAIDCKSQEMLETIAVFIKDHVSLNSAHVISDEPFGQLLTGACRRVGKDSLALKRRH